jgi:hypothetical protein
MLFECLAFTSNLHEHPNAGAVSTMCLVVNVLPDLRISEVAAVKQRVVTSIRDVDGCGPIDDGDDLNRRQLWNDSARPSVVLQFAV